jgi:hypothetical protein
MIVTHRKLGGIIKFLKVLDALPVAKWIYTRELLEEMNNYRAHSILKYCIEKDLVLSRKDIDRRKKVGRPRQLLHISKRGRLFVHYYNDLIKVASGDYKDVYWAQRP